MSNTSQGVVRRDEVYTLTELKSRLGIGDVALRKARERGLKVSKIGVRKLVHGADVLAFLFEDEQK